MTKQYTWGIIGCSTIAPKFIASMRHVSEGLIGAIASRNIDRAEIFAKEHKIPKAYGSYEELAQDPTIDVVYIANTNDAHKNAILDCLKNKKAVLCEKPMCLSYNDTQEIIRVAKENNVFLMEALWMRFLPVYRHIKENLDKYVGKPVSIEADFGFKGTWSADRRLLNKILGGGTLYDNGIYPISLAYDILGMPDTIIAKAKIGRTGVDESVVYQFLFTDGRVANLTSSIVQQTAQHATIIGDKGELRLPYYWRGEDFIHISSSGKQTSYNMSFDDGFQFEIEEVHECLTNGKQESTIMSHDNSLQISKLMGRIKRQFDNS